MNQDVFDTQIKRLKLRFGEKAFDPEFVKLIGKEVYTLSNPDFIRIVDTLIGTRPHSRPPILTDIREMRLGLEKRSFGRVVDDAANQLAKSTKTITEILASHGYNGCSSVMEAIEVEVIKLKVAKADSEDDNSPEAS